MAHMKSQQDPVYPERSLPKPDQERTPHEASDRQTRPYLAQDLAKSQLDSQYNLQEPNNQRVPLPGNIESQLQPSNARGTLLNRIQDRYDRNYILPLPEIPVYRHRDDHQWWLDHYPEGQFLESRGQDTRYPGFLDRGQEASIPEPQGSQDRASNRNSYPERAPTDTRTDFRNPGLLDPNTDTRVRNQYPAERPFPDSKPGFPVYPVQPVDPVYRVQPVDPVYPVQPADPVYPVQPEPRKNPDSDQVPEWYYSQDRRSDTGRSQYPGNLERENPPRNYYPVYEEVPGRGTCVLIYSDSVGK